MEKYTWSLIFEQATLQWMLLLNGEYIKKSGFKGFAPHALLYKCNALTNWVSKPTGSLCHRNVLY